MVTTVQDKTIVATKQGSSPTDASSMSSPNQTSAPTPTVSSSDAPSSSMVTKAPAVSSVAVLAAMTNNADDADFQAKKRRERLEQNRISARESRKRKKTMIEELQRSVITLSRESKELNQTNENIRRQLIEIGTKHPGSVPFHVLMAFDQQNAGIAGMAGVPGAVAPGGTALGGGVGNHGVNVGAPVMNMNAGKAVAPGATSNVPRPTAAGVPVPAPVPNTKTTNAITTPTGPYNTAAPFVPASYLGNQSTIPGQIPGANVTSPSSVPIITNGQPSLTSGTHLVANPIANANSPLPTNSTSVSTSNPITATDTSSKSTNNDVAVNTNSSSTNQGESVIKAETTELAPSSTTENKNNPNMLGAIPMEDANKGNGVQYRDIAQI